MHPRGPFTIALPAYAILFLLAVSTPAQTLKGTILGTVTDQTHAVVPAVAVKLTEVNTNFQRAEATNDSGFFAFANLDPGTYRIEVEHPGFRKVVRAGGGVDGKSVVWGKGVGSGVDLVGLRMKPTAPTPAARSRTSN